MLIVMDRFLIFLFTLDCSVFFPKISNYMYIPLHLGSHFLCSIYLIVTTTKLVANNYYDLVQTTKRTTLKLLFVVYSTMNTFKMF